jgi:hypothetical protein
MKIMLAVAVTASLAACGGEAPTNTGATNRKAMLDYARCMRQHGVNMPDPQFDGGRVTMRAGSRDTNPDTMRVADKACAKYRDAAKPPELSDADKEKFKKAALANARCMRAHGIDFPDPTFDENGGAQIKLGRGTGVDPDSPKFKAAMKACESTLPGPSTTDVDGK